MAGILSLAVFAILSAVHHDPIRRKVVIPMAEMPKRYVEEDGHRPGVQQFVSDELYGQAITAFVIVCTDTAIVDMDDKLLYLAKRQAKPANTFWIVGGRMIAGESEAEAVARTFERETRLKVARSRFKYLRNNRYWWRDREQQPQDLGSDGVAYTFTLEASDQEIEFISSNLDWREYDPSFGLQPFSRTDIEEADFGGREVVREILLDMYDDIFMTPEDRFLGFVQESGLSGKSMKKLIDQLEGGACDDQA